MKQSLTKKAMLVLVVATLAVPGGPGNAQEHPEHPKGAEPKSSLTLEEFARAITRYVTGDTSTKGGYFLVFDRVEKKPLALTLERVHSERLSALGGGIYFACADFTSIDGTAYDVDVFMQEGGGGLQTTEVHIHKVNGKPRYTWREEGGVWVRDEVE